MDATSWALIIALYVHPHPSDPPWVHEAEQIWAKVGVGGLPSERICQQAAREVAGEASADRNSRFEFRSVSCEPYARAEKISAAPSAR